MTSQSSDLNQVSGGSEIALPSLGPEDGARLLLRHLRRLDDKTPKHVMDQAINISSSVGGLPIAISHMAGYIDKTQSSLEEFIDLHGSREHSREIWSGNHRASTYQYDRRLDQVWTIALDKLPEDAKAMMRLLAMLSPDRISEAMLFGRRDQVKDLR